MAKKLSLGGFLDVEESEIVEQAIRRPRPPRQVKPQTQRRRTSPRTRTPRIPARSFSPQTTLDLSISQFIRPTAETQRNIELNQSFADEIPSVMTAKGGSPSVLNREDGFAETKWDGTRSILIKKGDEVRFYNGRGRQTEQTNNYPAVIADGKRLNCRSCILDGEFVFFDARGNQYWLTSSATQQTIRERSLKYKFMAFDILKRDNQDLRNLPIEQRKAILDQVVPNSLTIIDETKMVRKNKRQFFVEQLEMGREGVMFKQDHSPYVRGRSDYWLKIKRTDTVDVIAKGMTQGTGARRPYFGALPCYLPDRSGRLRHVGNVGGGFTNQDLIDVLPLARSGRPFVIEVKIMEWSRDGMMRMPSFIRLRLDKSVEEVMQSHD